MSDWPPLERTLGPAAFYSLYRGALAADSVQRRLRRCYVVVLGGRLGLRPGEILHCHEGWIDWGRGEVEVPALDPCACRECWAGARARQAAGDERPLAEIVRTEQWSPATDAGARTVAFGWSERVTALLATFFDYLDSLDCDRSEIAALVTESAEAAEGVDPAGLTPQVLRATGGRFLGEVGFDATSIGHALGLDNRETAEAFVRQAGQRISAVRYRAFDRSAVAPEVPPVNPARKFPVVCDPAPFSREPFAAADYGPEARFERAQNEAGRRVRNPRPADVPEGYSYDPDAHEMPEQADADDGQFSRSAGADVADMAALRDWISRKDASIRPESEGVASDATAAPGMDRGADAPGAALDPGDGPPPEPEPLDAATDGAASEAAATEGSRSRPADVGIAAGDPATVDDAVTQPLVARVGTRFATPGVDGSGPVDGQVVLGQDELLLVSSAPDGRLDVEGASFDYLPLDGIADVVPDVDGGAFDSSLGVVVDRADGRELSVVELDPERKWDFWIALFRNALHVSRMDVTHPARVGGRVTGESATPGMLYLDRDGVRFTPLGSDATLLSISLDDVLHVERTRQSVDGERQPALAIQQFVDGDARSPSDSRKSEISGEGEAVTSLVGSPSTRTLTLFERFVRRDYRERLRDARSLTIPDREKEVLVALYSTGEGVDLASVFTRDADRLRADVAALEEKGLVTADDPAETGLTATGRLVVGDRLEAVND